MTPVELIEQRIAELEHTQPRTWFGRIERDHTLHELRNILMAFKIQALNELQQAQKEAGIQ